MFRARRACSTAALLVGVTLARSARADEAQPATFPPPRAHQALLGPSALTQPTLTLSADLNGPMPGLTFTPVSFLQLQVTGITGISQISVGVASAKIRFLDTTHVKAAVFGRYVGYTLTPSNEGDYSVGVAVVTACNTGCSNWISLMGGAGKLNKVVDTSPSSDVGLVLGVNGYLRTSQHVGFVAEVNRWGVRGWQGGGAVRWSLTRFGLDVGALVIPVDGLPVLPWIALSYSLALAGH
jgi:hypothetical protein